MAAIAHLKGVRTRYRNILGKDILCAKELLLSDLDSCDVRKLSSDINKCCRSLQLYSEKLETQSEKLSNALAENDLEFVEEITNDDSLLCAEAFQCVLSLQEWKETTEKVTVKSEVKSGGISEEIFTSLQKDMHRMMEMQLQQNEKLLEYSSRREKVSSTRLPKLDLMSFNGDKTMWAEFWDSFKSSVHNNPSLSNIERFNYLRGKVNGEAQRAISGLSLSDANYKLAIDILKERFGNKQEVIELHYSQLINVHSPTNKTNSLRSFMDVVERHLRSLEVLNQNVEQDIFVSVIRSKLPEDVLVLLEMQKSANERWTVYSFRECLKNYIVAKERGERKSPNKPVDTKTSQIKTQTSPAQVLSAGQTGSALQRETYADKCRYCQQKHWSDQCDKYKTISERKSQLKGSCYKCLRTGHRSNECMRSKKCVYCGDEDKHHRSLCPRQFKVKQEVVQFVGETSTDTGEQYDENALVAANETVLMQTAMTEVRGHESSRLESVRLLFDSGSNRTYISEDLARRLRVTYCGNQEIQLLTFGSKKIKRITTRSAVVDVKLKSGSFMSLTVNVVPTISGLLHRKPVSKLGFEQVKAVIDSVQLADTLPMQNESSPIDMLIGTDYYLDFILSQRIELHTGLYLLASKLGWILTGRTNETNNNENTCMFIMTHGNHESNSNLYSNVDSVVPTNPNIEDFWKIESIGVMDSPPLTNDEIALKTFNDSLKIENGRFQVKWPWIEEFPQLPTNRPLAYGRLKSCVNRLQNSNLIYQYDRIIQDQLNMGVIEKVESTSGDMMHYLPHHPVINHQKTPPKLRVVYDASSKSNITDKSLNECMYRGPVMLQDLCGILMRFRLKPVALVADIEKAFLQIGLQCNDRDVTRFLWLRNIDNPS